MLVEEELNIAVIKTAIDNEKYHMVDANSL